MKILPCGLIVKIISIPQVLNLDLQVWFEPEGFIKQC